MPGEWFHRNDDLPLGQPALVQDPIQRNHVGALPNEPKAINRGAFFAVVHLSGNDRLPQTGREAVLQAGDRALYDATLPHRIRCNEKFSKLIFSILRGLFNERITEIEHRTATRIPGCS